MALTNETVFTWAAPPLKFGVGALEEVGLEAGARGARSVLVLTDPGVAETGVPARVVASLEAAGIAVTLFDRVGVEPTDASIEEAVEFARAGEYDAYVAVGGGSAIDTAKAVNLLVTQGGDLLDYVTPPIGRGQLPTSALKPLIAIPTTAGTGSESTTICVIDLLQQHLKAGVSHAALRPVLAIVDPTTTLTMPPEVTAASGMDVLSHALESYTSVPFDSKPAPDDPMKRPAFCGSNPISDVWCETALRLVGANLRRAVMNGRDMTARTAMTLASTSAGTGFGNAGTHLPHANAYPIAGAVKDYQASGYPQMPMVPHGQAVSVTAPHVFRWTYPGDPQRHLRAAELLSGQTFDARDGADALAGVLADLMRDIGIPSKLADFGYAESDIDTLVTGTMKQTRQLAVVPRPVTPEALAGIFRAAL
ncbi:iron-containing alcohol dehydrogenase [Calidifontibacter sp. DB0510]|uniref:hydroxyacid-oxoacid transhydrogenase n=1 Tax=Metallococcus carri TaxID=1656884 RepID=A0A967B6Y3_9MICO|nr:hydroxyacid-oxoacid transhydrogenase [Metallococcus carri]NHN56697.1 iron-containing alcohol dehydrogenase [Metallococcus carri]NOP37926.1 iron-containing alcohol dehydrogenase [Calidifontibacter sp. DB2511S]